MGVIETAGPAGHDVLTRTVERLSTASNLGEVTTAVAEAVRDLAGADGATFVLREDGQCFYADESAIAPLWKGHRFPLTSCVSGWAMLHRQTVVIPDIYLDERVPHDAYRPTFVTSLAMAPVRSAEPVGAIGAYWAEHTVPDAATVRRLEILANSAAVALENLELRGAIRRRSEERDRLAARADELDAAIHTLVHDLRSPLGAITGFAELIEDSRDPASTATYAATILRAGERMAAQIDRMLDVFRITSRPLEPETVDLTLCAREIGEDLARQHPERRICIEIADGLRAQADPVLIHSLLENLLGNAVKYSAHAPEALVEMFRVDGDELLTTFAVRDNGDGFDPADADRMFQPLVRLHDQEQFPGTGLGLASVARIVEMHGGAIAAAGARGQGATFTFTLPTPLEEPAHLG